MVAPRSKTRRKNSDSLLHSPQGWSRRLARLVGRKFGVQMTTHLGLTDGMFERTPVVIKCAKSFRAPISISQKTLERVSLVWGVFLDEHDNAHIYQMSAQELRKTASFYAPRNGTPNYTIRYRRFLTRSEKIGEVPFKEVETVEIP